MAPAIPITTQQKVILGACVGAFFLLHFAAQQAQHVLRNDRGSETEQDPVRSCFDGGVGTLTCVAKEGSKLYTNSIRTTLVHKAMTLSYSKAYQAALGQGLAAGAAEVEARQAAEASGKHTAQNAQRILGPLFAASLDGLEVLYNGRTLLEVGIRATGTLGGTWLGGVLGEMRMGPRLGYLIGSMGGSWLGGRLGVMAYDIAAVVQLLQKRAQDRVMEEFKGMGREREEEL